MIIWLGFLLVSVVVMCVIGVKRYSLSTRLKKIIIEVPNEHINAIAFVLIFVEMTIFFSDNSVWKYSVFQIFLDMTVLLIAQFILMRVAVNFSSSKEKVLLERRLDSIIQSQKRRTKDEFYK